MYKSLFGNQAFLSFFIVQFLGAFNDNVFKNALVILFTFHAISVFGLQNQMLVTFAFGVFILPFFLFSALAGQISDYFSKTAVTVVVKLLEVIIMSLAVIGLYWQAYPLLLMVLFLMGLQSALFGPVKYSLLPHLSHLIASGMDKNGKQYHEFLLATNGAVEMGTFLAILLGTIAGGFLVSNTFSIAYLLPVVLLSIALCGWLAALYLHRIHPVPSPPETTRIYPLQWQIFSQTWQVIQYARKDRDIFFSIILISWFWFMGAAILSQLPQWSKLVLQGDEHTITLLLTAFTLGVGTGSLLCPVFHQKIQSKTLIRIGMWGISLSIISLVVFSLLFAMNPDNSTTNLFQPFIYLSVGVLGVCGGFYIVPLYYFVQKTSQSSQLSQIIAANNILNALFMVLASLLIMLLLLLKLSLGMIFLILAGLHLLVSYSLLLSINLEKKTQ